MQNGITEDFMRNLYGKAAPLKSIWEYIARTIKNIMITEQNSILFIGNWFFIICFTLQDLNKLFST